LWRFDGFVLDTQRYELRHGDEVVRVEPQVFDVLTQLVRNRERCVTKEELFDAVWGGRFVGEAALTSRIKAARRALGDDGESQRYIRTVRGRGYQFVGTVVDDAPAAVQEPEPQEEPPPPRQHIAFCRAADGIRLAYAVAGEGPPLVRAANWMTHLGYDIESPVWRHWVRDLSNRHTFIRYDERGCGLSDWSANDFSFDDWVSDLESVVEALGLDRFPLLGVSQGGAVAVDECAYRLEAPLRPTRAAMNKRPAAISKNVSGSGIAWMLSTPSCPETRSGGKSATVPLKMRNTVVFDSNVAALPCNTVRSPGASEKTACVQVPPAGRNTLTLVTASLSGGPGIGSSR